MGKNFLSKLKMFSLVVLSFVLMICFQNCGKINLLTAKNGTPIAKGSSTPDPVADPPPDTLGGSLPNVGGGGLGGNDGGGETSTGIPTCFYLNLDDSGAGYKATFESMSALPVVVSSAKLFFGGNQSLAAASIDNVEHSVEFNISQSLSNAGLVDGMFGGPGYSVLIPLCSRDAGQAASAAGP